MEQPDQLPQSPAPSSDDRNIAMLAHLLGIFTSFVGALVIWLIKKDESRFIDEQAKEALNFQITIVLAFFVAGCTFFLAFLLMPLVAIFNFIFCVIAAIATSKGEAYRYPFALRLVK